MGYAWAIDARLTNQLKFPPRRPFGLGSNHCAAAGVSSTEASAGGAAVDILIVDDSKAMRMIVKRTLRQAGFDGHSVTEASNGREALDLIQSKVPQVVLCDWNMPEMTGIELLQELTSAGINVKFFFITSESSDEMRSTAREAGAISLITKPFTAENFQQVLGGVLA